MKDNTILVESIKKLLRRGAAVHLLNMLVKVRPADLAEAFKSLDEEEKSGTFRLLAERATGQAASLLGLIHPAHRPDLLRGMTAEDLAPVLHRLPSHEVAEILSGVPEEGRERIEADNAIHSDLERQRAEQHERGRHQAQHEYAADVGPVGPRLAEQPSTERQISVLRGHHTPLLARVKLKGDLV